MPAQMLLFLVWIAIPLVAVPVAMLAITATRRRLVDASVTEPEAVDLGSGARAA